MKISVVAVGRLKERYWKEAEAEYVKRLGSYSKIDITEVMDIPIPEKCSLKESEAIREKEGERIIKAINPQSYLCLLDLNGQEMDSVSLSGEVMRMAERGGSHVTFVIGGSLGLGENVRKRADAAISFSKLTFPHQLCRIVLLEQLYRSFRIARGEPYHK